MLELEDSELVEQYIAGKPGALETLVERYFRQVFLFARTYVKQDQEAEDVTQDVFVKVWKNIKKYDPDKKFKTWIFQITKNTCIDVLRKNKNALKSQAGDEEQSMADLEKITDTAPLPEEIFEANGFSRKLDETISGLPDLYGQVVRLHLQQDLTFQEISEILNQPLNTVKSRYRRALLIIRKGLDPSNAPNNQ
jgi:RNA polymerase sigma-70 factor (ECF subfamily)